jgi:ureidoacrylate peracid hydrolase
MANLSDHPLESLDTDSTALLVVDAQRGFTSSDSIYAERGLDVSMAADALPRLRSLVDTGREFGLPIVFTRTERRSDGKDAPGEVFDILPAAYQDYGEATLKAGTDDVSFSKGVEPRPDEYEVPKQFENAFHGTRLETYLRTEGVETLVVCGFMSNVCVSSTVRGAHERGFNIVMAEDASASYDKAMHEALCRTVEYIYGVTIAVDDLPTLLSD